MDVICVCAVSSAEGGLWGIGGPRSRKGGPRSAGRRLWLAGWTREAEREASKAVTAVAIEVAVVACCPTSEQAREDATEADEAVKRARRGGEVSKQRIGEREAEARVREVSGGLTPRASATAGRRRSWRRARW